MDYSYLHKINQLLLYSYNESLFNEALWRIKLFSFSGCLFWSGQVEWNFLLVYFGSLLLDQLVIHNEVYYAPKREFTQCD
jgi:hypothetical protein